MDKELVDFINGRFDSLEAQVAEVKQEVEKLKKRASLWGAVSGTLTALATGFLHRG